MIHRSTPPQYATGIRWSLLWREYELLPNPHVAVAVVRTMLEIGADPNRRILTKTQRFRRPMSVSVALNDFSLDGENPAEREEFTTLMLAIRHDESSEIVKVLLEGGTDPNLRLKHENWTSLHMGAHQGNSEVGRLLLERGADRRLQQRNEAGHLCMRWRGAVAEETLPTRWNL